MKSLKYSLGDAILDFAKESPGQSLAVIREELDLFWCLLCSMVVIIWHLYNPKEEQ